MLLTAAYVASPYVAVYRLGQAVRYGDATALQRLIDWDGVREGIKEDICDEVLDEAPPATGAIAAPDARAMAGSASLPPFGASFVRGIAGSAVDDLITADHLAAAAHAEHAASEPPHPPIDIVHAFFDTLTTFSVVVRAEPGAPPIRVQLSLRDGGWRVSRAWLPPELLQSTQRT